MNDDSNMIPWDTQFLDLFQSRLARYKSGDENFESYFDKDDLTFLASIGYKPRELFDFIEDLGDGEEPTQSTALLIAAARRDYFQTIQEGVASEIEVTRSDLPDFEEEAEGIPYLPRIIKKARAKLRGELHPDVMFCCGGDRKFLREHGQIHPADFLRQVWAAGNDDQRIIDFVKESTAS